MNSAVAPAAPPTRTDPPAVDPSPPAVAVDPPTRPAARPPRRGVPAGLWLVLILAGAALPMLTDLLDSPPRDPAEAALLDTSRQTWQRADALAEDGWSVGRFIPVRDGQPVLNEAPGAVWMHLLAWGPADPAVDDAASLRFRARLLSVGMALLAVAAVFWAGHALGGTGVAALAGLIVLANPLLTMAGRTANGEALVLGWTVLAGAAALWAMRPMKPAASISRQGFGWAICGVALGMTALVGGIDAALPAALPLALLVLLCPRRPGNLLGLAAAGAIGLLIVLPWVVYVHQHSPAMWERWVDSMSPTPSWVDPAHSTWLDRLAERGRLMTGVWGLWGLVVALALVWPFLPGAAVGSTEYAPAAKTANGKRNGNGKSRVPGPRRRLFVGWGWLVGVTVMVLLAPPGVTAGVLLVTLPVGALAAAQALWSVNEAAAQGRRVWLWRSLGGLTAVVVLLASGLGPWALAQQDALIERGWISDALTAAMSPWYWTVAAVVLGVLALGALVLSIGDRPLRAAACWACWSVVATTAVISAAAQGPGVAMVELDPVQPALTAEQDTPGADDAPAVVEPDVPLSVPVEAAAKAS